MKKITVVAFFLAILAPIHASPADEAAFDDVKLADANGKQAHATLIFSDINKDVVVRAANRDLVTIPDDQIDRFSYEYSKKHRIAQGAAVMVASLGAGAVIMFTHSKSHWLYIDYHEQSAPKTVVLRMNKKDYEDILGAIRTHTGKDVEFLGDKNKQGN